MFLKCLNKPFSVLAGSVSILPTILFLTTGVIREMAPPGANNVPSCVGVALQSLGDLCSSKFVQIPACRKQWTQYLRSALATVLSYASEGMKQSRDGELLIIGLR